MAALIAKCGVLVRRHEDNLKETMLSVVAYTWKHSQKGADPRTQEPTCQVPAGERDRDRVDVSTNMAKVSWRGTPKVVLWPPYTYMYTCA